MKVITAITTRTDAEWPPDHPLRKDATVISDKQLAELPNTLWVCALKEDPTRIKAPADDYDVESFCFQCNKEITHRGSAPSHIRKICYICFHALRTASNEQK